MKKYECKNWSMNDIAHAMKGQDSQGRRIVIPPFQRGKRWDAKLRDCFIDSLLKGYPVGTLLFADLGNKTFSVIDGLQRSSTICEYILNPTQKENLKPIDEHTLESCRLALFPESLNTTIDNKINEVILDFLSSQKSFNDVQTYAIAMSLVENFKTTQNEMELVKKLGNILGIWFKEYKQDFESICQTEIPVIEYAGENIYLNDIFSRINTKGLDLTDYEVYAATWHTTPYVINNTEIIDYVIKKYDRLTLNDYTIIDYDSNELRKTKQLTAFEFLFGFGKYIINNYAFLNLSASVEDDAVSPISFELVDVCINNSRNIPCLAEDIKNKNINLNLLARRIEESIKFVENAIASICNFRGNQRGKIQYLHPKYFILALIAFVFREMYDINNLEIKKGSWNNLENDIKKRILHHYVFEIIQNEWHDGGIGLMYSCVKEKTFFVEYTKRDWDNLLDGYYNNSLRNRQTTRFSNPTNADKLLLNCIYADIFTVKDNYSSVFDVEHIATKFAMKNLISKSNSNGLPVTHIANLCYLPESINRRKKAKTIYEDASISNSIRYIEDKYSFTKPQDLDFLYDTYDDGDATKLENQYNAYLLKRYKKQKEKILSFLGI